MAAMKTATTVAKTIKFFGISSASDVAIGMEECCVRSDCFKPASNSSLFCLSNVSNFCLSNSPSLWLLTSKTSPFPFPSPSFSFLSSISLSLPHIILFRYLTNSMYLSLSSFHFHQLGPNWCWLQMTYRSATIFYFLTISGPKSLIC